MPLLLLAERNSATKGSNCAAGAHSGTVPGQARGRVEGFFDFSGKPDGDSGDRRKR